MTQPTVSTHWRNKMYLSSGAKFSRSAAFCYTSLTRSLSSPAAPRADSIPRNRYKVCKRLPLKRQLSRTSAVRPSCRRSSAVKWASAPCNSRPRLSRFLKSVADPWRRRRSSLFLTVVYPTRTSHYDERQFSRQAVQVRAMWLA